MPNNNGNILNKILLNATQVAVKKTNFFGGLSNKDLTEEEKNQIQDLVNQVYDEVHETIINDGDFEGHYHDDDFMGNFVFSKIYFARWAEEINNILGCFNLMEKKLNDIQLSLSQNLLFEDSSSGTTISKEIVGKERISIPKSTLHELTKEMESSGAIPALSNYHQDVSTELGLAAKEIFKAPSMPTKNPEGVKKGLELLAASSDPVVAKKANDMLATIIVEQPLEIVTTVSSVVKND